MIQASENWDGFNFFFENGWEVSVQQSEHHGCKAPYTAEVAIIDNRGDWYDYSKEVNSVTRDEAESTVNIFVGSDEVAKIMAIVQKMPQLGIDSASM